MCNSPFETGFWKACPVSNCYSMTHPRPVVEGCDHFQSHKPLEFEVPCCRHFEVVITRHCHMAAALGHSHVCSRGAGASPSFSPLPLPCSAPLPTSPKPWKFSWLRVLLSCSGVRFSEGGWRWEPCPWERWSSQSFSTTGSTISWVHQTCFSPGGGPPAGDCAFSPRGQTRQAQWGFSFRHQLLSSLSPRIVQS